MYALKEISLRNYDSALEASPLGCYHNSFMILSVARTRPYITITYYSGSHKMKGTACALFGVATYHSSWQGVTLVTGVWFSQQGRDAYNRGDQACNMAGYALTYSHMHKNGSEAPGQDAVGVSWRQGNWDVRSVCFFLMAFPSRTQWTGSWTGRYQNELEVGHLRTAC